MSLQGATLFSDPNGVEWIIVAAGGSVFRTRENSVAIEISLNGETLSGDCTFTQCYDKLLLWRGTGSAPLQMETFDGGFVAVTQTTSDSGAGTGTQPIPNSDGARFFQNRVFVPFIYTGSKKDFVAVGDIGNYTRYKFPQNAFRFNDGADDDIVDLAPFGRAAMVVFKQKSVRIVDNLVPDASGDYSSAVSDLITDTHGLVARSAWTLVGRDLYYVSTKGVTSLRLTEENRVKGVDLPLSAAMEATWNRVNWQQRAKIRMGYWDNKLYVALPLDDARVVDDSTNLASGTYVLNAGSGRITITGLVASGWYYYATGSAVDTSAAGGTSVTGQGFVQATSTGLLILFGTVGSTTTATLYAVPCYNCNTGVMVYDFLTQAWAGSDETNYVTHAQEFLTPTIQGRQRLVMVTPDGLLRLYEEGFEDERITTVAAPYVDVTVESQPATGKTVKLNTGSKAPGTTISASTAASSNSGSTWGTSTTALARTNFYDGYQNIPWTAGRGTVSQTNYGLRFAATSSGTAFNLSSLSRSGTTVTATSAAAHGLASGDWVSIIGNSLPHEYQGVFEITVTAATTFTYVVQVGTGTTPMTGVGMTAAAVVPAFALNGVTIQNSGAFDWAYVDLISGSQITTQSVSLSVTTRAYAMQDQNGKAFQQATVRVASWNPNFTVTSITDGVNETAALASAQTRSRTSYAIAAPAWDATNANDDHGNPWREDYSVIVGTGFNLGSGVDPELHQESLVRLRMNQRGNSAQLRLANAQGRCVLKSVEVDAITGDRTGGTKYSG